MENNNLYPVYQCDDFSFSFGVLTIYDGYIVGMVKDLKGFNNLCENQDYNAIVIPELYKDEFGNRINSVIFK